jgi:hypothetical protein
MKKYTIVYRDSFRTGSHTNVIVRCERVEASDIKVFLKQDKYAAAEFVFEGWPEWVQ